MPAIQIIISGKVQGVFYRQSASHKARELGITGTVENLTNGTVKVIAVGSTQQLEAMVDWCKQGPLLAVISSVEVTEIPHQVFNNFSVI